MKVKFAYTCSCDAAGAVQAEENAIQVGTTFMSDCPCGKAIVIGVNEIDNEKKVVNYTVQIKKIERS